MMAAVMALINSRLGVASDAGHIRKRRDQRRTIVLRPGAAFQGIQDIIQSDLVSVVERYAFPKGKGVRKSIVRHLIVTGHGGNDTAVGAGLHQAFEDVEQNLAGAGVYRLVGVEAVQILRDTDRD